MSIKRPIHFVVETGSLAGGVRVIGELANRLTERGWDVNIWSVNPRETMTDWFKLDTRIKWISWLRTGTTQDYGPLADTLKKQDGIKLATFWRTCYATADAAKDGEGYYLVQDVESSYTSQSVMARMVMSTYQMPLRKLTTSRWVESKLSDTSYIGIGLENKYRPNLKLRRDRFILACARIQALKGWDVLCEAARYLHAAGGKIKTYGVEKKLPIVTPVEHFHLPTDDQIRQLYQRAGVFLSTSDHEGFNLTALEAMACGCPVSTTDSDGNREYIEDGENCLVSNDPYILAENCARIVQNKELSDKLSANGVKTASKYRWIDTVTRLEGILLE